MEPENNLRQRLISCVNGRQSDKHQRGGSSKRIEIAQICRNLVSQNLVGQNLVTSVKLKSRTFIAGTTISNDSSPLARTGVLMASTLASM